MNLQSLLAVTTEMERQRRTYRATGPADLLKELLTLKWSAHRKTERRSERRGVVEEKEEEEEEDLQVALRIALHVALYGALPVALPLFAPVVKDLWNILDISFTMFHLCRAGVAGAWRPDSH